MARKKQFKTEMISDKDGIRFATPEPVAQYRAKRLQCKTIADISCGIGGQALFFAKYCDFVYAIEIEPKKIAFAKKNAKMMGIDNIEFIAGDALSSEVIEKLPQLDVVFSDPARPPAEKERSIDNLSPSIPEVMKTYAGISSNFAFEAPPQLSPEKIPFDCEREYMSLEGKLNRLNLYFGELKKADVSAVALPGSNIIRKAGTFEPATKVKEPALYAYEPEECVIKSGLLEQLVAELKKEANDVAIFGVDGKRILLTSGFEIDNTLFKNIYKKMLICEADFSKINSFLKKNSFGKVIVRAAIDPEKYWDVRNELENGLDGERKAHLFVKDEKAIVFEVLDH